jgi:3',5'-cyclic-AMP phosphodiesterase
LLDRRSRTEPAAQLGVFAVEDRSIQVTWASLPSPEMRLEVGDHYFEIGTPPTGLYPQRWRRRFPNDGAGPGVLSVGGLSPSTRYEICLAGPGWPRTRVATATTLPPPPGRLLARFATISDCHIGERRLGGLKTLRDPRPLPRGLAPYPIRCARNAIADAEAWGAELLVVKGDLTQAGRPEELYDAADLLTSARLPVEVILGNHDVVGRFDAVAVLAACGVSVTTRARALDLPGARLVLGHTPVPHSHAGSVPVSQANELAGLSAEADGPVVLTLHHPPQRWAIETHYPPSIERRHSTRLLAELAAANPATLLIAGHTHRNRRYRVGGLTVAEVGSTKDYPGQWAGYAIHEGGIRQAVFRLTEPTALAWTERTRDALGGIWEWWSPGRLADRCWTLEWPDRVVAAGGSPKSRA